MSRTILENIRRLYDERIKTITVDEWPDEEGNPTVFYVKPWTVADAAAVQKQALADNPITFAKIIQRKARDADGKPIFGLTDVNGLADVGDLELLRHITGQILEFGQAPEIDADDTGGNI